jgi:hypothetical protein
MKISIPSVSFAALMMQMASGSTEIMGKPKNIIRKQRRADTVRKQRRSLYLRNADGEMTGTSGTVRRQNDQQEMMLRGGETPTNMLHTIQHQRLAIAPALNHGPEAQSHKGSINPSPELRIIGGNPSEDGEFPYYVDLGGCGGSLIAPDVVLSASHCAPDGIDSYVGETVWVGALRFDGNDDAVGVRVAEQYNHPGYNQNDENDFMLLRLESPVNIQGPVLELSNNPSDIQAGTPLTVLGLGVTSAETEADPEQLMDVQVNAISDSQCENAYGSDVFLESMFCAGASVDGKDSCWGDSGGPLVKIEGNIHKLVGVVSWGEGCGQAQFPGVYSRVPNYGYHWVKEVVCDMWGKSASFCDGNSPTSPPNSTPPPSSPPVSSPTSPPNSSECPSGEIFVEFEILTDEYGDETTWTVSDTNGDVFMSGGPYTESFETYYHSTCMPADGCYNLNVNDSWGDGMCDAGYHLKINGQNTINGDGWFGSSINHPFNCDSVRDGNCVPLVMTYTADEIGSDNEVLMLDLTTSDTIWDAIEFEPSSTETFEACLKPDHCIELYLIYGTAQLSYDGQVIYDSPINESDMFSFGC